MTWVLDVGDPEPEAPTLPVSLYELLADPPADDVFDWQDWCNRLDLEQLETAEGRREATKLDPLLFALLYLPHHLKNKSTGDRVSLSELHVVLLMHAALWSLGTGNLRQWRDAYISPRNSGKTTWLFLILPMWVAAHNYFTFIAAYSDSVEQARLHLATFRDELENNELLRWDYPDLVRPRTMANSKRLVSQRQDRIHQDNGFVFIARGMTGASLGMKIGKRRPELIILDDVEPGEERYSPEGAAKRLEALRSKIFYQNESARVVLAGTVTMYGSIIHQLVESRLHPSPDQPEWVREENFTVHYFPPISTDEQGEEHSIWPVKWSLDYLREHQHERAYKKNFLNQPVNTEGDWWRPEDITLLASSHPLTIVRNLMQIDPATTSSMHSHYTGIAVVGYDPFNKKCLVRHVRKAKLGPQPLRLLVLQLLDMWPEIGLIRIESNQGGFTWRAVLHGLSVNVKLHTESLNKELRTVDLLNHYQRGQVVHEKAFAEFESNLLSYPHVMEDDQIDAVSAAVEYFLPTARSRSTMPGMRKVVYA